ncbi:unnamed protein product [Tenebrio molitor]|nr:unnamed protein product [Tenebrio molitor]
MGGLVRKTFALNLRVLQFFGLYPSRNYKTLYKTYAYIFYFIFIVPPPILTSLYFVFGENVDLALVAQNAFAIAETGCFVFKLLQFIKNAEKIRKCIYMMENSIFLTYTQAQEHIIDEYISVCTRNSYFFLFFCILTAVSWAIVPLFGKEYKLPLDIWLPYDITSGGRSYILSYIFIVLGAGNGAISNGAIDPLIAGLACYATSQIKILKDNLQHLSEYAEENISDKHVVRNGEQENKLKCMIIYNRIKFCVAHHNAILDFIENYQAIYSSVVFTQFSASVLVICICCFKLSQVRLLSLTFMWMVIFLATMLSEIFLYCYFGTMLFEENNTLINSIYMGKWYEYDLKSQKALIMLMERSRKPIIVTAGKILDLSLETFTTILRRAYSLLAVLKNY